MKRQVLFFAVLLFLGMFRLTAVTDLLPPAGELPGWSLSGKPEHVEGEDLFLLINGGAEIYHEYGFKQAITGMYKKGDKTVDSSVESAPSVQSEISDETRAPGADSSVAQLGRPESPKQGLPIIPLWIVVVVTILSTVIIWAGSRIFNYVVGRNGSKSV